MIRFIDEHRDCRSGQLRWGIESIAKVLGIAPATYHAAKKRPPSARAVRDAELRPQIRRVWEQNLAVYGADKWHHLNHEDGVRVARCTPGGAVMCAVRLPAVRLSGGCDGDVDDSLAVAEWCDDKVGQIACPGC